MSESSACKDDLHDQDVICGLQLMHAKMICMSRTWDVVQGANTCKTAHTANTDFN